MCLDRLALACHWTPALLCALLCACEASPVQRFDGGLLRPESVVQDGGVGDSGTHDAGVPRISYRDATLYDEQGALRLRVKSFRKLGTCDASGVLGQAFATDINERGQVLGTWCHDVGGSVQQEAFVWDEAGVRPLGLGSGPYFELRDIAEDGSALAHVMGNGWSYPRLLLPDGSTSELFPHPRPEGAPTIRATALNDRHEVLGSSDGAVRYSLSDGVTHLDELTPESISAATAINNLGWMAGLAGVRRGDRRVTYAVRWAPDGGVQALPPFFEGSGSDINEVGEIVGSHRGPKAWSPTLGFLWNEERLQLLYPPDGWQQSAATAVNDDGWVVGIAADPDPYSDNRPGSPDFLEDTSVIWKGAEGISIHELYPDFKGAWIWFKDINNALQIVGGGSRVSYIPHPDGRIEVSGETFAFLLELEID